MTSSDHERYFADRERHCRTLAETHNDPFLRRIYLKFADNYARALGDKEHSRPRPRSEATTSEPAPRVRRTVV
ncbi:hypothetical protein HNQ99_002225 [Rhizorhapis suberifaciens]|uniref:Uncharacterized protein n=1 Tax=Rhizorhapis suberifaciens TaxID=13656 RepID=A0A840HWA9_9SPHN|nr:hypothetical protein [Rhizorhapis suberifaciens]